MIRIERFSYRETALAESSHAIRNKVFLEELGIDKDLEYEHEEESVHFLLLLVDKPVATARYRETEKGIKLERFAVLPQFRNRGFGEAILKEVLKDVVPRGKMIYLNAQVKAVRFYERNGFIKFGEQFTEAGIDHYFMKYHD